MHTKTESGQRRSCPQANRNGSSGSEGRREYQWEVHRQLVSDGHHFQEWMAHPLTISLSSHDHSALVLSIFTFERIDQTYSKCAEKPRNQRYKCSSLSTPTGTTAWAPPVWTSSVLLLRCVCITHPSQALVITTTMHTHRDGQHLKLLQMFFSALPEAGWVREPSHRHASKRSPFIFTPAI